MCGLQFFGQVTVRCVRILDRIVRKRRAAAKRFYQIPSCIRVSLTGIIVFLKNIRLGASTPTGIIVFLKNIRLGASTPSHALQRVLCQGQFPSAFTPLSNSFGSRFFLLTLRKEDERCCKDADDGAAESGKCKIACVEG